VADVKTAPARKPASNIVGKRRAGDSVFLGLSTTAAVSIMIILAGVAIFLILKGLPAITANWSQGDLAGYQNANWSSFRDYVAPLLWGSIWAALIAMVLGTPVAIGIALFISHYAPRRIAGFLGYIIDLLAAVPSIVFGLWGIIVMRPLLLPLADLLNQYFGWIPLFQGPVSSTGSTMLAGGVVLAVMILPIVTLRTSAKSAGSRQLTIKVSSVASSSRPASISSSTSPAEDSAPSTSTVSTARPSVSCASLALKPDAGSNAVPSKASDRLPSARRASNRSAERVVPQIVPARPAVSRA